jgi:hypothetical protein
MAVGEDRFARLNDPESPSMDSPLECFVAVTKSDTTDLTFRTRALILSAAGGLAVSRPWGALCVTFKAAA